MWYANAKLLNVRKPSRYQVWSCLVYLYFNFFLHRVATKAVPNEATPQSGSSDASGTLVKHIPLVSNDHDYVSPPKSDAEKLESAQLEIERLNKKREVIPGKFFCLERFSTDPALIHFYTGFNCYAAGGHNRGLS